MLSIFGDRIRTEHGVSRREMLRVGGLGFSGLMFSDLLRTRARAATRSQAGQFGRAKACILIFNYGGPSHLDMWDLKPDAPKEIRGEFKPISTTVPGIQFSEHLPRMARIVHHSTIL